jgi:hypothetical protein
MLLLLFGENAVHDEIGLVRVVHLAEEASDPEVVLGCPGTADEDGARHFDFFLDFFRFDFWAFMIL